MGAKTSVAFYIFVQCMFKKLWNSLFALFNKNKTPKN